MVKGHTWHENSSRRLLQLADALLKMVFAADFLRLVALTFVANVAGLPDTKYPSNNRQQYCVPTDAQRRRHHGQNLHHHQPAR